MAAKVDRSSRLPTNLKIIQVAQIFVAATAELVVGPVESVVVPTSTITTNLGDFVVVVIVVAAVAAFVVVAEIVVVRPLKILRHLRGTAFVSGAEEVELARSSRRPKNRAKVVEEVGFELVACAAVLGVIELGATELAVGQPQALVDWPRAFDEEAVWQVETPPYLAFAAVVLKLVLFVDPFESGQRLFEMLRLLFATYRV